MNPLIITIIVALGTFILAIFGATWLNQQMLKNYIDAKFEGFEGIVNARFDIVEARFKSAEQSHKALEQQLAMLVSRVERLERQLDQIFKSFLPRG